MPCCSCRQPAPLVAAQQVGRARQLGGEGGRLTVSLAPLPLDAPCVLVPPMCWSSAGTWQLPAGTCAPSFLLLSSLPSPDVHLPTAPAPAPPEMHQFQSQLVRVARDALEELPPIAKDADEAAARYMELVSSCKQSSTTCMKLLLYPPSHLAPTQPPCTHYPPPFPSHRPRRAPVQVACARRQAR